MSRLTQLPVWRALRDHAERLTTQRIAALCTDSARFEQFSRAMPYGLFDFSKTLLDAPALADLLALAEAVDLAGACAKLVAGDAINITEQRAVQHLALRAGDSAEPCADGTPIGPLIASEQRRMAAFTEQVRAGHWRGFTGRPIDTVVSIGIGGSNLGPLMVCEALKHWADGPALHFVSNVDGVQISQTLAQLDPATTLFVVASKTFTTRETMVNARTARQWLVAAGGETAVAQHFVAVTAAVDKARALGIAADSIFAMWDWVGGRFSLWSSIGLPIALSVGMANFRALLEGARAMDEHFLTVPFEHNVPVLMGLLGIWHTNFQGCDSHAILPYDQALRHLPAYLQQAEMESNGKSVTRAGAPVDYATCPVLWGQLGIDGQHAFYQLLHQGTRQVALDFIGSVQPVEDVPEHHNQLLANLFAQSQALMNGCDAEIVARDLAARGFSEQQIATLTPHKLHPGNRPSCTLLLDVVSPASLGALIALYEHKIFVQGVVWDICSYDQWGVELGKQLAGGLEQQLAGGAAPAGQDCSTAGLIAHYLRLSQSRV